MKPPMVNKGDRKCLKNDFRYLTASIKNCSRYVNTSNLVFKELAVSFYHILG
jgi:hypothetical protein